MTASLPGWHVDHPSSSEEWEAAARSVGVKGPGAMQGAKHLADAAVAALSRVYEMTSPSDIKEDIEALRASEHSANQRANRLAGELQDEQQAHQRTREELEKLRGGSGGDQA